MGMLRIWARNFVRGPFVGTNRKDCSPKDEGYLATMCWLEQFIPLRARTSDPARKEQKGISLTTEIGLLFTEHKQYLTDVCYLVTKKGVLLRSVRGPHSELHHGIYGALLSLGGTADRARLIIMVKNYSGNLTNIRLYKLPKNHVVLRWQELMHAHRTPEQIAADEERAELGRVRQAATEEAQVILQDA